METCGGWCRVLGSYYREEPGSESTERLELVPDAEVGLSEKKNGASSCGHHPYSASFLAGLRTWPFARRLPVAPLIEAWGGPGMAG